MVVNDLATIGYAEALTLQERLVDEVAGGGEE